MISLKSIAGELFIGAGIFTAAALFTFSGHSSPSLADRIFCAQADQTLSSQLETAVLSQSKDRVLNIEALMESYESGTETGNDCKMTKTRNVLETFKML